MSVLNMQEKKLYSKLGKEKCIAEFLDFFKQNLMEWKSILSYLKNARSKSHDAIKLVTI